MTAAEKSNTSLVQPGYRKTSATPITAGGVEFYAYRVGILSYARISVDGQCEVRRFPHCATYRASTLRGGAITNSSGKVKRFQSERAAMEAAAKAANTDQGSSA
jgi:hypothetical protein